MAPRCQNQSEKGDGADAHSSLFYLHNYLPSAVLLPSSALSHHFLSMLLAPLSQSCLGQFCSHPRWFPRTESFFISPGRKRTRLPHLLVSVLEGQAHSWCRVELRIYTPKSAPGRDTEKAAWSGTAALPWCVLRFALDLWQLWQARPRGWETTEAPAWCCRQDTWTAHTLSQWILARVTGLRQHLASSLLLLPTGSLLLQGQFAANMASAQEITPFSELARLRVNSKEAVEGKENKRIGIKREMQWSAM